MNISHKNIKAASFKPVDLMEVNKNIGVSLMGKYNLKGEIMYCSKTIKNVKTLLFFFQKIKLY
jgi:hypothetical protein